MLDPANVPDVDPKETLTRYLISKSHFRKSSQTVKPDAFVPHPHGELSTTRLLSITDEEIWAVGEDVAVSMDPPRRLYGRSDVLASTFLGQGLKTIASPLPDNQNHADVTDWPKNDKPAQKLIAQEIAKAASFESSPSEQGA